MAVAGIEGKKTSTILWQIENTSFWDPDLHSERIFSPTFWLRNLGDTDCFLYLYPKGVSENDQNLNLSLGVCQVTINFSLCCEWSLLDGNESPLGTWRSYYKLTKENFDFKLPVGPSHEDVFNTKKHSFLPNDTLTVRLRFWNTEGDFIQAEHKSLLTRFDVADESFVWRIKEFSSLKNDVEVMTPVSLEFPNKRNDLKLKFHLRGSSLEDSKFIFEVLDGWEQSLTLKISVLDNKQKPVKCVEKKHVFWYGNINKTWIVLDFLSRKEVIEKKSEWLSGDELTLLCQFNSVLSNKHECVVPDVSDCKSGKLKTGVPKNNSSATKNDNNDIELIKPNLKCVVSTLSEGIWKTSSQSSDQPPKTAQPNLDSLGTSQGDFKQNLDSVAALQEDFLSVYTDQNFSDFKLRTGDVTFPVHKVVLSARSPVFRSMLCSDMKEATSEILDISDLDVHCLNRMLRFLYTGTMEREMQWESAANLYYAADKYQVTTLKLECVSVLKSTLTVSNVSEMLQLADRHSDQEFMSSLHDFIVTRYDEVVLSEEWDAFIERNGTLAGKTMKNLYRKKRELEGKLH